METGDMGLWCWGLQDLMGPSAQFGGHLQLPPRFSSILGFMYLPYSKTSKQRQANHSYQWYSNPEGGGAAPLRTSFTLHHPEIVLSFEVSV